MRFASFQQSWHPGPRRIVLGLQAMRWLLEASVFFALADGCQTACAECANATLSVAARNSPQPLPI